VATVARCREVHEASARVPGGVIAPRETGPSGPGRSSDEGGRVASPPCISLPQSSDRGYRFFP